MEMLKSFDAHHALVAGNVKSSRQYSVYYREYCSSKIMILLAETSLFPFATEKAADDEVQKSDISSSSQGVIEKESLGPLLLEVGAETVLLSKAAHPRGKIRRGKAAWVRQGCPSRVPLLNCRKSHFSPQLQQVVQKGSRNQAWQSTSKELKCVYESLGVKWSCFG